MVGISGMMARLAALAGLLLLAACDNGPSAVETRPRADADSGAYEQAWKQDGERRREAREDRAGRSGGDDSAGERGERGGREDRRAANDNTPRFEGRPIWSSNRRMTAQENAESHWRRNGRDFGARDMEDYVAKAHAFIRKPPRGTLTLSRDNGDRLFYDPGSNTFAVATRQGAPRTMFKPDDGMDYWRRQIEREEGRGDDRGRSRERRAAAD